MVTWVYAFFVFLALFLGGLWLKDVASHNEGSFAAHHLKQFLRWEVPIAFFVGAFCIIVVVLTNP